MLAPGSFTLLLGKELACYAEVWGATVLENLEPDALTRALLRSAFKAHLGRVAVAWLPEPPPAFTVHQRRSLERVLQGYRPVVVKPEPLGWHPFRESLDDVTLLAGAPALPASINSGASALALQINRLRPANPGAGVGSWRARAALVVGDRPNPRSSGTSFPGWPFISQLREGCSAWLSGQLEEAGVPERRLYWINAHTREGAPEPGLRALYEGSRWAGVVTLGGRASRTLTELGVPHEQVHHPQHWKRFHFHQRYMLGKVLGKWV